MINDDEPIILALDSASKLTSIALSRGAKVIANFSAMLDENRSTRLWEIIDFLLCTTAIKINEIGIFAACTGPGGFTGLRVGIAAAKGLASATGKLTVGVTSLEAFAASVDFAPKVYSLINAYKGEVYSQLFSFDENRVPIAQNEAMVCTLDMALERVKNLDKLVLIGDAATAHWETIKKLRQELWTKPQNNQMAEAKWKVQRHSGFLAEQVALMAFYKSQSGLAVKPDALQATYVRGADIKIKAQG
jgi:tRNA threonylcarbamoyladenosine biosynthesis protein TsaB